MSSYPPPSSSGPPEPPAPPGMYRASDGRFYPLQGSPPPSGPRDPSVIPPGSYRASDGNVYPQPGYPQQFPPAQKKGGAGKVLLIVGACILALCGLLGLVAVVANPEEEVQTGSSSETTVAAATTAAGATTGATAPASTAKPGEASLYPNRPDKKKGDKERVVGQSADLSGYTVTLTSAAFQQEISLFEKEGYLITQVSITNRDKSAQSYNFFHWKLITPQGTIIDPCFCVGTAERLSSGDLVTGGRVEGAIPFEVKGAKGAFYLIFDPPGFGDERAIWQITI